MPGLRMALVTWVMLVACHMPTEYLLTASDAAGQASGY
jgi:hypothetical protein